MFNKKIFFVCQGKRSFFETDISILRENFTVDVCDLYPPSLAHFPRIWRGVAGSNLVYIWFLGKHAVLPLILARILGKKTVLVAGGWDVADCPEINYGLMRRGPLRFLLRWLFNFPDLVLGVSEFNLEEIKRNAGVPPEKTRMIYHGIKDSLSLKKIAAKDKRVITVGEINLSNLKRKGLEVFVRAAAFCPEVEFVVVGKAAEAAAMEYLKKIAPPNVRFSGFVPLYELEDLLVSSSVYAQLSFHEAFGCSVAEAMLFECVPVVTDRGALPEVVGDTGYTVPFGDPEAAAQVIARAMKDPEKGRMARNRVIEKFSYRQRRDEINRLMEEA